MITQKGYLLLEALIAVLILGTAIISLVGSMQAAISSINYSRNQFKSLILAESTIEELKHLWAQNEANISTNGQFHKLDITTTPPLRDRAFSIQYRAKNYMANWGLSPQTPSPVWHPVPAPIIPPSRLYILEVFVTPVSSTTNEGAAMTILLASRS